MGSEKRLERENGGRMIIDINFICTLVQSRTSACSLSKEDYSKLIRSISKWMNDYSILKTIWLICQPLCHNSGWQMNLFICVKTWLELSLNKSKAFIPAATASPSINHPLTRRKLLCPSHSLFTFPAFNERLTSGDRNSICHPAYVSRAESKLIVTAAATPLIIMICTICHQTNLQIIDSGLPWVGLHRSITRLRLFLTSD